MVSLSLVSVKDVWSGGSSSGGGDDVVQHQPRVGRIISMRGRGRAERERVEVRGKEGGKNYRQTRRQTDRQTDRKTDR